MITRINGKTFEPYLTEEQINRRIGELAELITQRYEDKDPLFISVLNGSFLFAADLFRQLGFPCRISFIKVSSYTGTQSDGTVNKLLGLKESVAGQHVIVLEDIIDTGLTMDYLLNELKQQQTASVAVATLLFKKECLKVPMQPDFVGFEVPDRFLVGYGLDYDGYGRNRAEILVATGE